MAESAHYDIDSTPVRAHVSSSGRRPPHAVRSAGVAYLPICGFQEFHPVGRVSSCGWVALCERRRAGFARLSGLQLVGNWVASAANFPASLSPVGVIPTTSRQSRRTVCVGKWPEAKPSVTRPITGRQKPSSSAEVVFFASLRGAGPDDWKRHYGPAWQIVQTAKTKFDPKNVLTPGHGMFPD